MSAIKKIEFGDFQTPLPLARQIAVFLHDSGEAPGTIIEPTCGRGSFVVAAMETFRHAKKISGFDINPDYVREAIASAQQQGGRQPKLECQNFFQADWLKFIATLPGDIMILGNPPWVTNSAVSALGGSNLPAKTNFQGHNGFAAKTGKANFDISEWMLLHLVERLHRREGCVAMLCKTAIARKTLRHAWLNGWQIGRCSLHLIDAQKSFGAAVDACLLILHTGLADAATTADVYPGLSFDGKLSTLGLVGKELVADIVEYERLRDLDGLSYYTWRSGVKHDAAGVMEFKRENGHFINGQHEVCRLEPTLLYPMLKSSDLANKRLLPARYVLVTQQKPSDATAPIEQVAPKTWSYLTAHSAELDQRRSIIYTKRPRFSVFGVGDYTFAPWKVAVSGMYKSCRFEVVGTHQGKATVLDDTCYFIPCSSKEEARFICELLNSDICQRFLRSLVFFDAKRPITIDTLNRIDLKKLAMRLHRESEARRFLRIAASFEDGQPLFIFEKKSKYRTKQPRKRQAQPRYKTAAR